jgi:hypothetical protein
MTPYLIKEMEQFVIVIHGVKTAVLLPLLWEHSNLC